MRQNIMRRAISMERERERERESERDPNIPFKVMPLRT
jgi:hypothetical protein